MYTRSFALLWMTKKRFLWMTRTPTTHKNHQQKTKRETMETKSIWQKILHIAITILTAIATTLGTTSCMGL